MKTNFLTRLCFFSPVVLATFLLSGCPATSPYFTGTYRNIFMEWKDAKTISSVSDDEIRKKIGIAWFNLFDTPTPDVTNPSVPYVHFPMFHRVKSYLPGEPNPMGCVTFYSGSDVDPYAYEVWSENMSAAMLLAIALDGERLWNPKYKDPVTNIYGRFETVSTKYYFDAIFNWLRTFSYQSDPNSPWFGYYAWRQRLDANYRAVPAHGYTKNPVTNEYDIVNYPCGYGQQQYATALFLAYGKWHDSTYLQYANDFLTVALQKDATQSSMYDVIYNCYNPATSRQERFLRIPLNCFNADGTIRFFPYLDKKEASTDGGITWTTVSQSNLSQSDPAYCQPANYNIWARWASNNSAFWVAARNANRNLLNHAANYNGVDGNGVPVYSGRTSGLFSNTVNLDGSPISNMTADEFNNPSNPLYQNVGIWRAFNASHSWDAKFAGLHMGLDFSWFQGDTREITDASNRLLFFNSKNTNTSGVQNYHEWYHALTGSAYINRSVLNSDFTGFAGAAGPGCMGMNAALTLCVPNGVSNADTAVWPFIADLWSFNPQYDGRMGGYLPGYGIDPINGQPDRTYNGIQYLVGMTAVSGLFKVYMPTPPLELKDGSTLLARFDSFGNLELAKGTFKPNTVTFPTSNLVWTFPQGSSTPLAVLDTKGDFYLKGAATHLNGTIPLPSPSPVLNVLDNPTTPTKIVARIDYLGNLTLLGHVFVGEGAMIPNSD